MQISRQEQLNYINKLKDDIRDHKVVQNMFKEHGVDIEELDLIPMAFADLDVSARTDHGIIYLSYKILENDIEPILGNDHYLVHELTHVLQQTTGDKPTKGSKDGKYLDNEFEQESFQNQSEYIADEYSEEKAEQYIDRVLDKHNIIDEDEREDKKDVLLSIAKIRSSRRI